MKIVLTGGTGYIGRSLVSTLAGFGHEITVISRVSNKVSYTLPYSTKLANVSEYSSGLMTEHIRGSDVVINLAGANVGSKPWTQNRKTELLSSRLSTTSSIVKAIKDLRADERPSVLVSASGIDYYGDLGDEIVSETSSGGTSFLADLCIRWEKAALQAEDLGVRVVLIRTATVVGPQAKPIQLRLLPFRMFCGGPFRPGTQWFSWIHLEDLIGLYNFVIENKEIRGPLNGVAPGILREFEAARIFGQSISRPSWLPVPALLSRILLRERADLFLHGRQAKPVKALAEGYEFKYLTLSSALNVRNSP